MEPELKALIIDTKADSAQELTKVLQPEIVLDDVDFTNSTLKAIQSFVDGAYNICFIADQFPMQDLESFFRDTKKLSAEGECIFIQVREEVEAEFDRRSLNGFGFSIIISRKGTHKDRECLKDVLSELSFTKEVKERVTYVNDSMNVILSEIDKAAGEKKRGRAGAINSIRLKHVSDQTEFDSEILDEYFEALTEHTKQAQPETVDKLNVPQSVLSRELPHLSGDKYTGASQRVWKKLKKNFGDSSCDSSEIPAAPEKNSDSEEE